MFIIIECIIDYLVTNFGYLMFIINECIVDSDVQIYILCSLLSKVLYILLSQA